MITESGQKKLKYNHHDPAKIAPNGDRYLVEVLDTDDTFKAGSLDVYLPDTAKPEWIPAIIVSVGNGHRLDQPDLVAVETRPVQIREGVYGQESRVTRPQANVRMFYKAGDVVALERYTNGRQMKLRGKVYAFVNQSEILCHFPEAVVE